MSDQEFILKGFKAVTAALQPILLPHQIADIPASLFFIKRFTDSASNSTPQPWLTRYIRGNFAEFVWEEWFRSKSLLPLLQEIEKCCPTLMGLSTASSLAHLASVESSHPRSKEVYHLLDRMNLADMTCREASSIFQRLLDDANRSPEHSTPISVRRLLAKLLAKEDGSSLYDPVCGSGSLLCDAARVRVSSEPPLSLCGRELHPGSALIAKMNTLLGHWNAHITVEDSLAYSPPPSEKFDIILANPPFGLSIGGHQDALNYLPSSSFEGAIIKHVVNVLSDCGRAAILVPNGFLSRRGKDNILRSHLIDTSRIHAVISLPSNLFFGTTIAASVLIIDGRRRQESHKGILFVDLTTFAYGPKTQRHLTEDGIEIATASVSEPADKQGIATVISEADLATQNYDLTVSRYVRTKTTTERSLEKELDSLITAIEERNQAEQRALSLLKAMYSTFEDNHND